MTYLCDPRYLKLPLGMTERGKIHQTYLAELEAHRRLESESGDEQKLAESRRRLQGLSEDFVEGYFGDSPWVTNVDKMNALENVFSNPNTLGKDLHGHDWKLYDCDIPDL